MSRATTTPCIYPNHQPIFSASSSAWPPTRGARRTDQAIPTTARPSTFTASTAPDEIATVTRVPDRRHRLPRLQAHRSSTCSPRSLRFAARRAELDQSPDLVGDVLATGNAARRAAAETVGAVRGR
jgi:hypothetical protein